METANITHVLSTLTVMRELFQENNGAIVKLILLLKQVLVFVNHFALQMNAVMMEIHVQKIWLCLNMDSANIYQDVMIQMHVQQMFVFLQQTRILLLVHIPQSLAHLIALWLH
jgi:hypothetical protein